MARSRRMSPGPFFGLRGGGGASFTRKSVAFRSNKCTSPTRRSNLAKIDHGAAQTYEDPGATLDDLRKAVDTLEEIERIARRVFGGAHPTTKSTADYLQDARAALRAREAGTA